MAIHPMTVTPDACGVRVSFSFVVALSVRSQYGCPQFNLGAGNFARAHVRVGASLKLSHVRSVAGLHRLVMLSWPMVSACPLRCSGANGCGLVW